MLRSVLTSALLKVPTMYRRPLHIDLSRFRFQNISTRGCSVRLFFHAHTSVCSVATSNFALTTITALDYRLAPETRFPGPLHDAVSAYFRLVDDLHISPENIIIAGDSAGGGLSLALLLYLRDNEYPMPGGAILMSPWVG